MLVERAKDVLQAREQDGRGVVTMVVGRACRKSQEKGI